MTSKTIKFVKTYAGHSRGDVATLPSRNAAVFVQAGAAEYATTNAGTVARPAGTVRTATATPPAEATEVGWRMPIAVMAALAENHGIATEGKTKSEIFQALRAKVG